MMMKTRAWLVFLLASIGCSEDNVDGLRPNQAEEPKDAGATLDGELTDATTEDGGAVDAGTSSDGGDTSDGGVDAGIPPGVRRLVPYRLLGTTPTDNLVINPRFDPFSSLRIITRQGDIPPVQFRLDNPTKTPIVTLSGPEFILLAVQGYKGSVQASIWVGRPPGQSETTRVALVAFGAEEDLVQDLLTPFPDESLPLGDWVWTPFRATIDAPTLGQIYLQVASEEGNFALNGPVVIPATEGLGRQTRFPRAIRQPLPPSKRAQVQTVLLRWHKEHARQLAPPPAPEFKAPKGWRNKVKEFYLRKQKN